MSMYLPTKFVGILIAFGIFWSFFNYILSDLWQYGQTGDTLFLIRILWNYGGAVCVFIGAVLWLYGNAQNLKASGGF